MTVLELYLTYKEAERSILADRIQRHLETPAAEAEVEAFLPGFEAGIRTQDPAVQELLEDHRLAQQLRNSMPHLTMDQQTASRMQEEKFSRDDAAMQLNVYGRRECFVPPR